MSEKSIYFELKVEAKIAARIARNVTKSRHYSWDDFHKQYMMNTIINREPAAIRERLYTEIGDAIFERRARMNNARISYKLQPLNQRVSGKLISVEIVADALADMMGADRWWVQQEAQNAFNTGMNVTDLVAWQAAEHPADNR